MNKVRKDLDELVETWKAIPGVAVCIVSRDQDPLFACSGYASLEHGVLIDQNTRFNLASISKQFTAFAIRLIEKRGKLKLDDPIRQYLPEFSETYQSIQIQHLLHHTGGLKDMFNLLSYSGFQWEDVHSNEQLIALIKRQSSLSFTPGDRYFYNNMGYILLAEIIQRITGMDLPSFMEKECFLPLGMKDTSIPRGNNEVLPNVAEDYILGQDGEFKRVNENMLVIGSSNLFTTIYDFSRWLGNYVAPVYEPEAMMGMDLTQSLNDGSVNLYACGLLIMERDGRKIWTHSGFEGGFHTNMVFLPGSGLAVGVMSNNGSADMIELGGKVLGLILPKPNQNLITRTSPQDLENEEMKEMKGCYQLPDGLILKIIIAEKSLLIRTPYSTDRLPLMKVGHRKYKIESIGMEMEAVPDEVGQIIAFNCQSSMGPLYAVKLPPLELESAELAEYTGKYWNEELFNMWELQVEEGHLTLFHPHFADVTLIPVLEDEFSSEIDRFEELAFHRSEDGRVNGLEFRGNRALYAHFKRVEKIIYEEC